MNRLLTKKQQILSRPSLRLVLWGGSVMACVALSWASSQYEAAREAMGPPPEIATPHAIHKPDLQWLNALPKARLRAIPAPSASAAPAPSTSISPQAAQPESPARPSPLSSPQGPSPAPGAPAAGLQLSGEGERKAERAPEKPLPLENPEQIRLQADNLRYEGGAVEARGHLEARYRDMTIRAEEGRLDKERVWGEFSGDVRLETPRYSAQAPRVRLNLETEEFSAHDVTAKIEPEYFQGQVHAPLYMRAEELVGRPDRVTAEKGLATSCDIWPDPHWALRSDKVTVAPENYVVFRRPALYLFGHRLFQYPWDLRLSLRARENRFWPEVGQNEVEGYFLKFAYGYLLNEENTGFLRLHLTQKRGIGVGLDHTLETGAHYAELSLFAEPAEHSWMGRLLYRGRYSETFTSNLNMSFQENSGYGSARETLSGDLVLRYDTRSVHTSLGLQHSMLSSGNYSSARFSTTLSHRQTLGTRGDWELRATYRSSQYAAMPAEDEELETQFSWRQDFGAFTAQLAANRRFDVDGGRYTGDASYFSLDRLPDLTLTTDSHRLRNLRLFGQPFNATIYFGYFAQQPTEEHSLRTGFELSLPSWRLDFGRTASLRTSLRFRQMFYQDAAQWTLDAQTEYRLQLPGAWETRLRLSYSHPEGFAPLRLDYAAPAAALYAEAVRLVAERMRLHLSCGRDLEHGYYHDALVRGEFMLSPRNRLELQGGYSVQNSEFRPLNLRWIFATPRSWWSALTINYDLARSELTNLSLDLDWTVARVWRIQFLGAYSSWGGFDQADIRITRDLHCMLAQLSYSTATREIRFGLGIKAFPSETRTFGLGARGQYFESNFADIY